MSKTHAGSSIREFSGFFKKFFYLVQLHQCLNRGKGVDLSIQYIFLDLLKQWIVKLDETQLKTLVVIRDP